MNKKIHKDMIVADVVALYPEAADIMMSFGLHCVGCHANAFETIEQGILGHGYPEDHLQKMIEELNAFAEEMHGDPGTLPKEADEMSIHVTPKALRKIHDIAQQQEKQSFPLRVEVKNLGGVLKYALNFIEEEKILPVDKIFPFQKGKVRIVIDKRHYKETNGLQIDYAVQGDREGFKMQLTHAPLNCRSS